ncbi:hypothetical protein SAMN05216312_10162 [Cohnella sp. OV330]|uniref:hypothetical protein n=1 Tax=Cohnella sp. OV330 TaxID=1855288 RepID=UPI0008E1AA85|nr:hypothetical protein [Cohnella sp. OV330]SFA71130.1 hypothetical protein SAMN05216312_10162 [Cohnella sp. OV330]
MLYNPKGRSHPPSFTHLRRMTDDTGLLEHALGRTPRRREGYTTDDNARSLWAVTEWLRDVPGAEVSEADRLQLLELASIYLSFMLWQQKEDGWWHNNVAYDRSPESESVSYDCQGRSIWACVSAWVGLPDSHKDAAKAMFECAMPTLGRLGSLRGKAYALSACAHALESERLGAISFKPGWREQLKTHVVRFQDELIETFLRHSDEEWRWFEPQMSYGNGVLPWALLRSYRVTHAPEALEIGLDSLSSLQAAMTAEEGWFRPVGNAGWRTRARSSKWDQQPLEIFKLALALEEGAVALEEAGKQGVALLLAYDQGVPPQGGGADARSAGGDRGASGFRGASAIRAPEVGIALAVRSETEDGQAEERGEAKTASEADAHAIEVADYAAQLRAARNRCLQWFFGDNDLGAIMADESDGSGCDGLQENGPNVNCGAESTIAYLMTSALCR